MSTVRCAVPWRAAYGGIGNALVRVKPLKIPGRDFATRKAPERPEESRYDKHSSNHRPVFPSSTHTSPRKSLAHKQKKWPLLKSSPGGRIISGLSILPRLTRSREVAKETVNTHPDFAFFAPLTYGAPTPPRRSVVLRVRPHHRPIPVTECYPEVVESISTGPKKVVIPPRTL